MLHEILYVEKDATMFQEHWVALLSIVTHGTIFIWEAIFSSNLSQAIIIT